MLHPDPFGTLQPELSPKKIKLLPARPEIILTLRFSICEHRAGRAPNWAPDTKAAGAANPAHCHKLGDTCLRRASDAVRAGLWFPAGR